MRIAGILILSLHRVVRKMYGGAVKTNRLVSSLSQHEVKTECVRVKTDKLAAL